MALSEQGKTRPKSSNTPGSNAASIQQVNASACSPLIVRKGHSVGNHLNPGGINQSSHHSNPTSGNVGQSSSMGNKSDTVTLPVDLTAESSSVSSLSRKIQNTGILEINSHIMCYEAKKLHILIAMKTSSILYTFKPLVLQVQSLQPIVD